MEIIELFTLLTHLFVVDTFGSRTLFGLFILLMFGIVAFKLRLSFDAFGVSFAALIIVLAAFGLFSPWVIPLVVMVMGLLIAFGILRVSRR